MSFITNNVRALIGVESAKRTVPAPLSEDALRRFAQAVMEGNPVHWDAGAAEASRYDGIVATPLFPLHPERRAAGTPDPFDRLAKDPELDGTFSDGSMLGLPPIDLPIKRVLNGGTEAKFYRLARVGDVISAQSKYVDITEPQSKKGEPMVIVSVSKTYTNQDDELLAVITISVIRPLRRTHD